MEKNIINELKDQGSILAELPKKYYVNQNDIPSGYFEGMEDRLIAKIRMAQQPKTASISIWERYSRAQRFAAAASVAVIGLSLYTLMRSNSESNFSQNEMKSYLISEGEYADPKIAADSTVHIEDLSKEDIKRYILENEDIDINTI